MKQKEIDEINLAVKSNAIRKVEADFNRDTKGALKFKDLTNEQMTVILSVAFQYGDLSKKTPNFWRQVVAGDWAGAKQNLRNFGDDYSTRRNKEADLLM